MQIEGSWNVRIGDDWSEGDAADVLVVAGDVATWRGESGEVVVEGEAASIAFGRKRLACQPVHGDSSALSCTLIVQMSDDPDDVMCDPALLIPVSE